MSASEKLTKDEPLVAVFVRMPKSMHARMMRAILLDRQSRGHRQDNRSINQFALSCIQVNIECIEEEHGVKPSE